MCDGHKTPAVSVSVGVSVISVRLGLGVGLAREGGGDPWGRRALGVQHVEGKLLHEALAEPGRASERAKTNGHTESTTVNKHTP